MNLKPHNRSDSTVGLPRKGVHVRWGILFTLFAAPVVIIATAGLVLGITWTIREAQGRRAMQVELARLEDERIPTTCEGLAETYWEQTTDEFAEDWDVLFNALRSLEFAASTKGVALFDNTLEIDPYEDRFDISAQWKDAENSVWFVEENQEWIKLARRLASEKKPNRFPLFFESIETKLQEVQDTRTLARMLWLDAQVAMHLNDRERAFDDTVAMVELTKHVDAVPFIVSRLTGTAIRDMALKALQKGLSVDFYDDAKLQQIDELCIKYTDIGDRWRTMIENELSGMLPVFSDPDLGKKSIEKIPARGHDAIYFINLFRVAMALPTDDWEALHSGTIGLEDELRRSTTSRFKRLDVTFSGLLAPSFSGLAGVLINEAQLHRQARVAIAIRRYQHEHGRLPSSLGMLPKSTASLTPFGELPFGYEVSDSKAVLWGFVFSEAQRQTPKQIPDTTQENSESFNNRNVVWELGVGKEAR